MENDTTAPAEVEQVPAAEPEVIEQPETPAEAKARRVMRLMASEIELPDFDDAELPEETRQQVRERLEAFYAKAEETAGQLNRGVDSKFKEAAQLRQALESERENVTQWRQQQEELISRSREAAAIYESIKDYENVDWWAQINAQPDEEGKQRVRDAKDWYHSQREKLTGIANQVRQVREQEKAAEQQEEQKITQVGEQILSQRIKGWGPKMKEEIVKALPDYGIGKTHPKLDRLAMEALSKHPGLVEAVYEATLWRKSQKGVVAESQQAAPAPARPASKVGGNATVAKDPDKMVTDEWLRWRNSELRKKK
jgi:hypothetical protein